ncbi:MAG: twin-arginine translocase TatA/TatE family subunit [Bacteroidales bacterium]|nr:twin-arginine translocase TatA/TatE family subunit [Bacteroidales bacterium]
MLLFIGTTEILVIGGIALLLFGGKKLPEMMRGLGKGVKEFKEGMHDVGNEIRGENDDKTAAAPQAESQPQQETSDTTANEEKTDTPA